MRRVRIHIHNIITNIVIEERDEKNIPIIDNVITKREAKRREAGVDVSNYSRGV